ncbi:hypothetical protein V8E52_011268 [Russula decolorans]
MLHQLPPSTAHITAKDADAQTYSNYKLIGRILSNATSQLCLANDGLSIPLHHRGTLKTYEHLEDLLKEAGYKETHIFTPENGVDTVVGVLAGLVLGQPHGQLANPRTPRGDRVGQATLVSPLTLVHGTPLDIISTARTSLLQIQGAPCWLGLGTLDVGRAEIPEGYPLTVTPLSFL